ncbi:HEPN domain protein [Desulfofarcimen acetoxidans DSM 771]|uniref:HEPN domain protein n=1 Tax=Desulfofarcimen acetoxidans (strain ATCC 49208 / DSM 771 / KCTC 5769 / VKM B-1644 / 5575) TaxID=485916 RepID=C8VYL4_DESAS|nr:HEPN domain-containing protein [Desulfofarcimen acetoxidans]ACV64735.1 HEPN domain protein [Desulfofarcimen acetoxidans DSM 771]
MTKNEIIRYWITSAERDYQTMMHLYDSKDYHWSLFMGHLVLEKLLKAVYVARIDTEVPRIHDLLRLSEKAALNTNDKQKDQLDMITSFNIAARYPDYKHSFYQKCTPAFTKENLVAIEELKTWLLVVLEKK